MHLRGLRFAADPLQKLPNDRRAGGGTLRDKGVLLVGAEGESIGDRTVHRILLENEIAVLEGAKLSDVPAGEYFLFAAPVPFGGCDGAPVRAVLVKK